MFCSIKIGDLVKLKTDDVYGFVTYIEKTVTNEYFIEVVYDENADPLYFYEDELEVLTLIKE